MLVRRPGSREFVELDATAGIPDGSTIDTKRGVVELTVPAGGTARFRDGIFRINRRGATHRPHAHRGSRAVQAQRREGVGEEAEEPQAVGPGQRQVPDRRLVQRGDGPGHAVARPGQLLRDADPGHPRGGLGP